MKSVYRVGLMALVLVGAGGLALATTRLAPRQEAAPAAQPSASNALDQWPVGRTPIHTIWTPIHTIWILRSSGRIAASSVET